MLPKAENQWTWEEAAHLLNRAGFGGNPQEISQLHALGRHKAVDFLLSPTEAIDFLPAPEWTAPEKRQEAARERFAAFRDNRKTMPGMTPEEALRHPTWEMGGRITIDSATLMNKGFEMIEAHHLFGFPYDSIEVVVHPESILHSLVEYADGSSLAQLGPPYMRTPIAVAFAWPDRVAWPAPRLELGVLGRLTFEPPDPERFPALGLARQALCAGGAAPGLLNAANEVAVEAFLDRRIGYLDIAAIVSETLDKAGSEHLGDDMPDQRSDDILEYARRVDRAGRRLAAAAVEARRARGAA